MRMPPQIARLVLVALGIGASYAIARVALRPKSFGEYGHFRGAAIEEIASRQRAFAGANSCSQCHADVAAYLAKGPHAPISCEACHGPALAHTAAPRSIALPKHTDALCLRCHEDSPTKPTWLNQVAPTDHYSDGRCAACHRPHQPSDMQ